MTDRIFMLQLFWPDDKLWYLVEIIGINMKTRTAKYAFCPLVHLCSKSHGSGHSQYCNAVRANQVLACSFVTHPCVLSTPLRSAQPCTLALLIAQAVIIACICTPMVCCSSASSCHNWRCSWQALAVCCTLNDRSYLIMGGEA